MRLPDLLTFDRGRNLFLPAHGRGSALPLGMKALLRRRPGIWDLPELPDLGGPTELTGAISESQKASALAFGADYCWYGVNGATGLLQAALFSVTKPGQAVLMPRNVHRSLIFACILGGFKPVLFDLPFQEDRCHYSPLNEAWLIAVLDQLVRENVIISAVVLLNPTYQGYSSELKPLVKRIHSFGFPVIVDEAHGTHFHLDHDLGLPQSAIAAGADLVVNSLHKSSLGLVQTAVLWLQGDRVTPDLVDRSINSFQTSSPSALLLASCEVALRELKSDSGVRKISTRIKSARKIFLRLREMGLPFLENQDPLRLILHTSVEGITGFEADNWFIANGLIAELPEPATLTFCLGFSAHHGLPKAIRKRWMKLLIEKKAGNTHLHFQAPPTPLLMIPSMDCGSAWRSEANYVDLSDAVGKVSADLVSPYPPGIPIVIPGEVIKQDRINWLIEQRSQWPDQIPSKLRIVAG